MYQAKCPASNIIMAHIVSSSTEIYRGSSRGGRSKQQQIPAAATRIMLADLLQPTAMIYDTIIYIIYYESGIVYIMDNSQPRLSAVQHKEHRTDVRARAFYTTAQLFASYKKKCALRYGTCCILIITSICHNNNLINELVMVIIVIIQATTW